MVIGLTAIKKRLTVSGVRAALLEPVAGADDVVFSLTECKGGNSFESLSDVSSPPRDAGAVFYKQWPSEMVTNMMGCIVRTRDAAN